MEELEAALKSAVEETDRVVQLAEDLLVIARSDQGKLPVRLTPVEVRRSARRRQRAVRHSQPRDEARAGRRGDRGTCASTADPIRLRQALGNMVDNALRYGRGTVRLSARASNGHVELHVSDEGPGFPPDFLDTAFERFSRADGGRGRGGTGLGLAIVASDCEGSQGRGGRREPARRRRRRVVGAPPLSRRAGSVTGLNRPDAREMAWTGRHDPAAEDLVDRLRHARMVRVPVVVTA